MSLVSAINLPYAGLGNRMRFTLSCRQLALAEQREFEYYWPQDDSFEPHLTDLWEWGEKSIEREPAGKYIDRAADFSQLRAVPTWKIKSGDPVSLQAYEVDSWERVLYGMRPVSEILRLVEAAKKELPEKYFGVQIRANEKTHAKTLANSPVDWYRERIAAQLEQDSSSWFFVSCDVPEIQESLELEFVNVVGLHDKGEYNSTRAVRMAIADLYLLASSQHMYSAYWSSFPYLAYVLSGMTLVDENSVSTRGPRLM